MPRILIVDDEPQIRTLLSMSLGMAGYDVTVAEDGFEAMTLCTSETFDAILTDLDMPRMNGHELVHWVAGNSPMTRCALMSGLGPQPEFSSGIDRSNSFGVARPRHSRLSNAAS